MMINLKNQIQKVKITMKMKINCDIAENMGFKR